MSYASKGILRHYNYQSDPKLGPEIVAIRRTPCIFYTCTAILSISWVPKIKGTVNQHIYGKFYNYKYSQILGCHNNWILFISKMTGQMKNIMKILIKLFLMVM